MSSIPVPGAGSAAGASAQAQSSGHADARSLAALQARYAQMFAGQPGAASAGAPAGASGLPYAASSGMGAFPPPASFSAHSYGALLPSPSSVAGGNGGFSAASSDLFGIVAPKLAAKDATLTQLRSKIASGADLHPNELLMYQDLMQQQNQLFMFAQNVFSSEHEKVKSWAQSLGSIGRA